jgi:hypothetical protein
MIASGGITLVVEWTDGRVGSCGRMFGLRNYTCLLLGRLLCHARVLCN